MIKRAFDVLVSIFLLILLSPVILILSVLIRIFLGGPILFIQSRPGKNQKEFNMMKFRSMSNDCDSDGNILPDSIRLSKFGRILRSTSMDELPGLVNVVKGDMSLVGPRPLLVKYLPYYSDVEKVRFNVRPGITGWAQVNGRNSLSWDKRLSFDTWYVSNQSIFLDVKILLMTVFKVFNRDGLEADTSVNLKDLDIERK